MTRHSSAVTRFSLAKYENTARGQAEEDCIDRDDVVENTFVSSGQSNNDREQSLESDRHNRCARSWMDHTYTFKKQAVLGHREVNSWRGEHALTQIGRAHV